MSESKRKSPIESATLFSPGTTKKGVDGNRWIVAVIDTKNGPVQRWKRVVKSEKGKASWEKVLQRSRNPKHATGPGFLFKVKNSEVSVYIKGPEDSKNVYSQLSIKFSNVQRVFSLPNPKWRNDDILLSLPNHQYVFIGEFIYSFKTPNGDDITDFFPKYEDESVAIGEKNVYFLKINRYIPRRFFPEDQKSHWMEVWRTETSKPRKSEFAKHVKVVPHFKSLREEVWFMENVA